MGFCFTSSISCKSGRKKRTDGRFPIVKVLGTRVTIKFRVKISSTPKDKTFYNISKWEKKNFIKKMNNLKFFINIKNILNIF